MKYFRIRNWRRFQHYRDRRPIWIKFYTDFIDPGPDGRMNDLAMLADAHLGQLARIWALAAKMGNCIRFDPKYVEEEAGCTEPVDFSVFSEHIEVFGSRRECVAAESRARASILASKSASAEEEEEEEKNQKKRKKGGSTVERGTGAAVPVDNFPASPDSIKISEKTEAMFEAMADERGVDLGEISASIGLRWPLHASPGSTLNAQVTRLKSALRKIPQLDDDELQAFQSRMSLDRQWADLVPILDDADLVASEIGDLAATAPREARGLCQRLRVHLVARHGSQEHWPHPYRTLQFEVSTLGQLPALYSTLRRATADSTPAREVANG